MGRTLRVAIVGAGPSGFFAAQALLAADPNVRVDLLDRLVTPYGLVRGGVAPDHQKIKAVTAAFDKVASSPGVRFLGNVSLGADVTVEQLLEAYDQVLLTTGAEEARRLGIPGESLSGVHTATAFVGWYNGHPDHQDHSFDLSGPRAVVVGMGNVAIDVARILCTPPDALHPTDLAGPALEALRRSCVKEVVLLGRRGPIEAAFTPAELQELLRLEDVDVVVSPSDLAGVDGPMLDLADKQVRKNIELLVTASTTPRLGGRRIVLKFLRSPLALHGETHLERVELGVNRLQEEGAALRAVDTGDRESVEAGLLFEAVGYRSRPIPGVPFDPRRGRIRHVNGRVCDERGVVVPRLYVAGWAKRGPQGVIGTNRADAKATVAVMVEDQPQLDGPDRSGIEVDGATSWQGWQQVDRHERSRGDASGRVREKMLTMGELVKRARE